MKMDTYYQRQNVDDDSIFYKYKVQADGVCRLDLVYDATYKRRLW